MIKAIIFDLGGVLIIQPSNVTQLTFSDMFGPKEKEVNQLWQQFNIPTNLGQRSMEDFFKACKDTLGLPNTIEELSQTFESTYATYAHKDEAMLQLVRELHQKYNIYILTDTIKPHFHVAEMQGIFTDADYVFASYREGVKKPFPQAFQNIMKKTNLLPEECVYVDDLAGNITVARELGMHGIVFRDLNQLKGELTNIL